MDRDYFSGLIKLLRPQQYYKNVLIFLGIVFTELLFKVDLYFDLLAGFIALCAISSVSYIINDLVDAEKDRLHPEKKTRPIASGLISIPVAIILALILIFITFILIFFMRSNIVKIEFSCICCLMFITSQAYSFYFKNITFADVMFIALNYVWRAVAGVIIIQEPISPWLIVLGFVFALFLALSKRKGDLLLLGEEEAKKHKIVFEDYTMELLDQILATVASTMILSYALYTFETVNNSDRNISIMLLTVPLVTFIIFRWLLLLNKGGSIARKAELIFFDKQIMLVGIIVVLMVLIALYLPDELNTTLQFFYTANGS